MLALALAVLVAAQLPSAPPPVRVSGVLIDAATAAPVAGARIALERLAADPAAPEPPRHAVTDGRGRFSFDDVASGRYRLVATTGTGQPGSWNVDVDRQAIDLRLAVDRRGPVHRETVTVSAGQADAATAAERRLLDGAALNEMRGVAGDDPVRVLQTLPGAATGDDFQAAFSMRGSAFRHMGIVVDGIPAAELLHAVHAVQNPASIAMIGTDTLRRAAVQAGPGPLAHGEWLGPILEFDIRDGARDRARGLLLVSGTAASALAEGPAGSRASWLVSFRRSYLDWLIRAVEPDFDSTLGFFDGTVKIAVDLTPAQRIEVLAVAGDAVYHERDAGLINSLQRAESGSAVAAVGWRRAAPRWTTSARMALAGSDFQNLGASRQELARGYTQTIFWRGEASMTLGGWTADGGLQHARARMNRIEREFARTGGRLGVATERDVSPRTRLTSGWGQLSRRGTGGVFTAGIRVADRTISSRRVVLPWALAERRQRGVLVSVAAGATAQYPDPRLAQAPGIASEPEHARGAEASVRSADAAVMWRVAAFYRREGDVLRVTNEPRIDARGRLQPAAVFPAVAGSLSGRTHGVDVVVSGTGAAGTEGWIGYTWSRTVMRDEVTGETFAGDFDQRHTLNAVARLSIGAGAQLGASFRAGSNFPLAGYFEPDGDRVVLSSRRNGVRLPVYARLDVRAQRRFRGDRLTLFLEVLNVLGRRNVGQAPGAIRPDLELVRFTERLVPRVPSAGLLVAF